MIDMDLLPNLNEGMRWKFANYGGSVELRLQKRKFGIWYTAARAHLNVYLNVNDAVDDAVIYCLEGRNWIKEIHASQPKREKEQKRYRDNFPMGVVKK